MLAKEDIEALAAGAAKSPVGLFAAIADIARRRINAGLVTAMRHDEAASTVVAGTRRMPRAVIRIAAGIA